MDRINFSLVVHSHQPIGNDPEVVEEIYRKSYLPFIERLVEYPTIKTNLHYSGPLLDWIEQEHPEFIDTLRKMVKRNQVEILGGGYYEPILAAIPDRDAIGQTALMKRRLKALFGCKAQGFWLAERVWEPHLPEVLASCEVDYTVLDDTIFTSVGVAEEGCLRPYLVESRGSPVIVFPMLKSLRYLIPWKKPHTTLSLLRRCAGHTGKRIAVYGDDGEKFGAWPNTYDSVYHKGWLDSFFKLLQSNEKWLNITTLSEYLTQHKNKERIYLPSASYDEMMEWSLPADIEHTGETTAPRRGFWRLFLSKYPESRRLYAKMLSVSEMAKKIEERKAGAVLRELWKGQCNDAYWHGVFGGLYLPRLRRAAYHYLIKAQNIVESIIHRGKDWLTIGSEHFDGHGEFTVNTKSLGIHVCPWMGGSVCELDFKPKAFNLLDSLARRREAYHTAIFKLGKRRAPRKVQSIHGFVAVKEPNLHRLLVYDRYPKASFVDHVVEPTTRMDHFLDQSFTEVAGFAGHPYDVRIRRSTDHARLSLLRRSRLQDNGGELILEKTIDIPAHKPSIRVAYRLKAADKRIDARFATEINFGSLGDPGFTKSFERARRRSGIGEVEIRYPEIDASTVLKFDERIDVWLAPIRTVSQSESGFESNLQGVSVIPNRRLELGSQEEASLEMTLTLKGRIL